MHSQTSAIKASQQSYSSANSLSLVDALLPKIQTMQVKKFNTQEREQEKEMQDWDP